MAGEELRVHISVDIEGICGVTSWDYCNNSTVDPTSGIGSDEYEQGRRWMENETAAAALGAFEAGATQVVVADGHGGSTNIVRSRLRSHPRLRPILEDEVDNAKCAKRNKRSLVFADREECNMMLSGIQGCEATVFLGYHGRAGGDSRSFLQHTTSGAWIELVKVNGTPVSEGTMNAAVAARKFGSKLILVSGTDFAIEEMKEDGYRGVVYCTAVKSLDRKRGEPTQHPRYYCERLKTEVKRAIEKRHSIEWSDSFEGNVKFETYFKKAIPLDQKDDILAAIARWTGPSKNGTILEEASVCFHAPGIYEAHAAFRQIMWHLRTSK